MNLEEKSLKHTAKIEFFFLNGTHTLKSLTFKTISFIFHYLGVVW